MEMRLCMPIFWWNPGWPPQAGDLPPSTADASV
jgi:hypothetical protein